MVSHYDPESAVRSDDVDTVVGESPNWVNSPVLEEDDTEFSTSFCEHSEESALEVRRLCEQPCEEKDGNLLSPYWHEDQCFRGDINQLAVSLSPHQSSFIKANKPP